MSGPLRLAGNGRREDGAIVIWTIAEGRRGRRWREVITRDGAVVHSLLLETDTERRFSHLELSVAGALVTLHPEPDGTLHGNRVSADGSGVSHVAGQAFGPGAAVLVAGSPIARAALVWGRRGVTDTASTTIPLVTVDLDGRVGPTVATSLDPIDGEADPDGLPALSGVHSEPLEA